VLSNVSATTERGLQRISFTCICVIFHSCISVCLLMSLLWGIAVPERRSHSTTSEQVGNLNDFKLS